MTKNEVVSLVRMIAATYPASNAFSDEQKVSETVKAWAFLLAEYRYEDIATAFRTFVAISNSKFPPSVSELIGLTHKGEDLNELSDADAWAIVRRAISNAAYHAAEEFEKLPEMVQKAVGSPNMLKAWSQTELESIDTVVASNFRRTFRSVQQNRREETRLPEAVRIALGFSNGEERRTDALIEARKTGATLHG